MKLRRAEILMFQKDLSPELVKSTSDPCRVRPATAIQARAAQAGGFQLFLLSWVGIRLPDIFRSAFHSASVPPAGANRGRYASGEADLLNEEARAG